MVLNGGRKLSTCSCVYILWFCLQPNNAKMWHLFLLLLTFLLTIFSIFCYFLKVTNIWRKKVNTKKPSQYFGCSTVTNSSILVSQEQCAPAVVCLPCAAPTDEGKERPPATELPLSVTPLRFSRWQVPGSTWWERGTASLHHTAWIFTGIVLKVVKLRTQPESVICLYDDNIVFIPLLHGKWQDEENWHFFQSLLPLSLEKRY